MNSTFKVVFNKARGALMVVNEVTSSVQAKGTKTVVATAVAAMIAGVAGTAMAEGDTPIPPYTSLNFSFRPPAGDLGVSYVSQYF